jgi:hypothetical protein
MCDFISGFININTGDLAWGDLHSHSESARILGIAYSSASSPWRELEWTGEGESDLKVRVLPTDKMTARQAAALILSKYPARSLLLKAVFDNWKLPTGIKTLDLSYATIPRG